jgi:hypothetical protein
MPANLTRRQTLTAMAGAGMAIPVTAQSGLEQAHQSCPALPSDEADDKPAADMLCNE